MYFDFSFYLMVGLGLLMIIVLLGTMINLYRLYDETSQVYLKLKDQMKAIEASRDGIAILDAEGNFTYMNKAHAICYGFDNTKELIGRNWRDLYAFKRKDKFERDVFPLLHKERSWIGQSHGLKKDGSEFPQEISLNLLDDGGLICVVRDITEKVKNETLLYLIKLAVEAADDGIAITDSENRLLFMNQSYLKIHGYNPHDIEKYLHTDWRFLYNEVGQEQINSIVLPTMVLKGSWSGDIMVMKKDGTLFYGDASLTKLPDGLILGVMRDVSDRRIAEKEREELKEQVFQSQKIQAIGRLTDGIAHDFNKILSTINKFAGQLQDDDSLQFSQRKYAQKILNASGKAQDLVDQLLAFSSKKDTKDNIINLRDSVEEVQKILEVALPDTLACIVDIKVDKALVSSGSGKINQILLNLCLNAEEAMEGRRGKIAITLKDADRNVLGLRRYMLVDSVPDRAMASTMRMKQHSEKYFLMTGYLMCEKNYMEIIVSDNGKGILPDILANIFDPFFTTKSIDKGTGLGLSTVHGMIIGGNGAIIVETIPDVGTSIHLFLPKVDRGGSDGASIIQLDQAV